MKKPFHIYSKGGFEGAYATERGACTIAKKGSAAHRSELRIYKTGPSGFTGNGKGLLVAIFFRGVKLGPDELAIARKQAE